MCDGMNKKTLIIYQVPEYEETQNSSQEELRQLDKLDISYDTSTS